MASLQKLRLFTLCERYRHGSYREELLEIEQECNRRDAERAALRAEVERLRPLGVAASRLTDGRDWQCDDECVQDMIDEALVYARGESAKV